MCKVLPQKQAILPSFGKKKRSQNRALFFCGKVTNQNFVSIKSPRHLPHVYRVPEKEFTVKKETVKESHKTFKGMPIEQLIIQPTDQKHMHFSPFAFLHPTSYTQIHIMKSTHKTPHKCPDRSTQNGCVKMSPKRINITEKQRKTALSTNLSPQCSFHMTRREDSKQRALPGAQHPVLSL